MADLFTYVPEEVTFLVLGFIPISGFVDGTFITINKDIQPFTASRTADGQVTRTYNNDQTYTISLALHSGSESNDILTKIWQIDEITQLGKFPLLIKDGSGTDLFFSTTTWIEAVPTLAKSNSVDQRVWLLRSSQAVVNVGSNANPASLIQDIVNIAAGSLPALEGVI